MNQLTKITFGIFIAALPFAYFTAVPAILGALVFLVLYGEQRFVEYAERETLEALKAQLEKHDTAINALNMKAGFGPMPTKAGAR